MENPEEFDLDIDLIASDFEKNWEAGRQPVIEDWLEKHQEVPRKSLLVELLLVELSIRESKSENPNRAEYERRFSADSVALNHVFNHCTFLGEHDITRTDYYENDQNSQREDSIVADAETQKLDETRPSQGPQSNVGRSNEPRTTKMNTQQTRCDLREIDKYVLEKRIGKGGMGEVYLAHQKNLNRKVALKVINEVDASSQSRINRFKVEANSTAKLDHPNIIPILDFGEDNGIWFIAMPVIDGGTMSDLIKQGNDRLDLAFRDSLLSKMAAVAEGLEFAHQHDVIHRDIKPANILLDKDLKPIIADFGLAKIVGQDGLTGTSDLMGSPLYLSPEQAQNSRDVGPATDIHALGVILYQIVTNGVPFKSDTAAGTISRVIHDIPTSPCELNPDVSKDLETIILKCLEKEPAARYETSGALAADLRRYLNGEPILARPTKLPTRAFRWAKRKPQLAGLIASLTCLFIAAGLAAVFFMKTSRAEAANKLAAIEQRDEAIESKILERDLRQQAEAAKKEADVAKEDAEDAARFAETYQTRAALLAAEYARQAGKYHDVEGIISGPDIPRTNASFDTRWYKAISKIDKPVLSHFVTSDWGLYDSQLSAGGKRVATVDRAGRVDVWDVASGKRLHKLSHGVWSENGKRHYTRWLFLVGELNTNGPGPIFFSSIAWESNSTLLATTVDGRLVRFDLDESKSDEIGKSNSTLMATTVDGRLVRIVLEESKFDEIWKSETPLHFVRIASDNDDILLVDENGKLVVLGKDLKPKHEIKFSSAVSHLREAPELDGWIVGGFDGRLEVFDRQLKSQAWLERDGIVNDARIVVWDDTKRLLCCSGESPLALFELKDETDGLQVELRQEFRISNREPAVHLMNAIRDETTGQFMAIDSQDRIQIWDSSANQVLSYAIGPGKEIRQPSAEQASKFCDKLELRNGTSLENSGKNILQVNRIGDTRLVESKVSEEPDFWEVLSVKVGPNPQLAANPVNPNLIWALDRDGTLSLVSLSKDELLSQTKNVHKGGREELVVLSNGDVMTVGNDQWIKIWRFANGKIQEIRRIESQLPLLSLAVHQERDLVAAVDELGDLRIWGLSDGKHIKTLDLSGYASAGTGKTERPLPPINTGKVAFSKSGEYVAAFGVGQRLEVFQTSDFVRVNKATSRNAGVGGTAICFSPIQEHRFLASDSLAIRRNSVLAQGANNDKRFKYTASQRFSPAEDFAISNDQRRVVTLSSVGEIEFLSAEYLISICLMQSPNRDCCSVALTAMDAAVVVGISDGTLSWCPTGDLKNSETISKVTDGVVHWVVQKSESPIRSFAGIRGKDGHLQVPFTAGSASDDGDANRLYLLEKQEGIWRFNQVNYEGNSHGPSMHAKMLKTPAGKRMLAVRQLHRGGGQFDGRVMLLAENDQGEWKSETVMEHGNAGFYPFVKFQDNQPSEIFFEDFRSYQLLGGKRKAFGDWEIKSVRGNYGSGLSGVADSKGNLHFIAYHWRGSGSPYAPSQYMRVSNSGDTSVAPAKGRDVMIDSKDRVISIDDQTGELFELQEDGEWKSITQVTSFIEGSIPSPFLDSNDRMWFSQSLGDRIVYQCFDHGEWTCGMLKLDQRLPTGKCTINLNADNRLEILLVRGGKNGKIVVVESIDPIGNK